MEAHLHGSNQTFAENKNPKEEAPSPESPPSPPPPLSSSTSSSPSHEFSFTISLQSLSSSFSSSSPKSNPNNVIRNSNKTTSSTHQPPFAIDLSPADEIFFHGHLLPLHFLSHLPVSPRTSTNSFDGFTLQEQSTTTTTGPASSKSGMSANSHSSINSNSSSTISNINSKNKASVNVENREMAKPNKYFSLFGLPKWRKGFEQKERRGEEQEKEQEKHKNSKKLMGLDLSHAFRKYIRILFQRRENGTELKKRQAYSFSSASIMGSRKNNINTANKTGYKRDHHLRGTRGEFSAPASMRTSPTNSGHLLVSTGHLSSSASSCFASDSTMEELQAAIQAAIAHCKNSFAVDHDKVNNY